MEDSILFYLFFFLIGVVWENEITNYLVSIASLLLQGNFREESYLIQEYMFGWVVFNSSHFSYNEGKHKSTYKCGGINDTLVSVTGLNWINSLSPGKDIKVVTVKWVNLSSSLAFEFFCQCFLSSELNFKLELLYWYISICRKHVEVLWML